jgi:hypothetical protein
MSRRQDGDARHLQEHDGGGTQFLRIGRREAVSGKIASASNQRSVWKTELLC